MKLSLIIRFAATQPIPDLTIPISINFEKDDVNTLVNAGWIKNVIRSKVSQSTHNRLRLIYNGRVLNENTDFKNEVLKPKGPTTTELDQQIYIHCVIGEVLTREQLAQETQLDNRPQEVSTAPQVIGFDRLLQQGFSQDDINDLRRQFFLIYGPSLQANETSDIHDLEEEEARQRTIRQMEERWIESTVNGETNGAGEPVPGVSGVSNPVATGDTQQTQVPPQVDLENSNENGDFLLGLLLGVFLGVISLVFLMADDTVFSKRQKMSIIGGIIMNFSFALVRGQWI